MSVLTKARTTDGYVEFRAWLPSSVDPEKIRKALEDLIAALSPENDDEERVTMPRPSPAQVLRGARLREDMTQAQLAQAVGVARSNVCDMERGRRAISIEMAKKFGAVLKFDYKVFL
jgi:DNA-binding XRE family transcriptional regulator